MANKVNSGSASGSVLRGLAERVDDMEVILKIVVERPSENYRAVYLELDDGLVLDESNGDSMESTFASYDSPEKCSSVSARLEEIIRQQCVVK